MAISKEIQTFLRVCNVPSGVNLPTKIYCQNLSQQFTYLKQFLYYLSKVHQCENNYQINSADKFKRTEFPELFYKFANLQCDIKSSSNLNSLRFYYSFGFAIGKFWEVAIDYKNCQNIHESDVYVILDKFFLSLKSNQDYHLTEFEKDLVIVDLKRSYREIETNFLNFKEMYAGEKYQIKCNTRNNEDCLLNIPSLVDLEKLKFFNFISSESAVFHFQKHYVRDVKLYYEKISKKSSKRTYYPTHTMKLSFEKFLFPVNESLANMSGNAENKKAEIKQTSLHYKGFVEVNDFFVKDFFVEKLHPVEIWSFLTKFNQKKPNNHCLKTFFIKYCGKGQGKFNIDDHHKKINL